VKDYYALLGVGPDAAPDELRRAYRDKAQAALWDRPLFTQLSEAWEVLKDPEKRDAYTRSWRAAAHAATPEPAPVSPAASSSSGGARAFGAAETPPTGPQQTGTSGVTTASGSTITDGGGAARVFSAPGDGSGAAAMSGAGGERTQQVNLSLCPICQTPGTPGEKFCLECGFLVGSTPGAENAGERPLPLLVHARTGQSTRSKEAKTSSGANAAT
jgi:curved DNA-binding protein CbpA